MHPPPPPAPKLASLFPAVFGALLGLALVKFGNPVILGALLETPQNPWEWVFFAWPLALAFPLLLAVLALGVGAAKAQGCRLHAHGFRRLALWLPLAWLGWQLVAAATSVDPKLTRWALGQFAAAVVCFYLGFAVLGRARSLTGFWLGLLAGFAVVLTSGWQQHFGGLAESRKHFLLYVYPTLSVVPPELMKRMTSGRIFATLFYPNTLAMVILLLLPAMLGFLGSLKAWLTAGARRLLMGLLAVAALGCLVWSGSKGGWLIMLIVGLGALLHLEFPRRWKLALAGLVLMAGLFGFLWRYAAFFEKGATSVGARFDYWRAAGQTVGQHPLLGSGPGTFGVVYAQIKRPESEMSRMAHNDYLQQGSDSGIPGLVAYGGFMVLALAGSFPRNAGRPDWFRLAVWLGVLGWALQGFIEFGLYIPATAWLGFGLLGWLLAAEVNRIDKPAGAASFPPG